MREHGFNPHRMTHEDWQFYHNPNEYLTHHEYLREHGLEPYWGSYHHSIQNPLIP
jgi:hypothetical protein